MLVIFLGQLAEDKAQISLEGPFLHPGNTSQINSTEHDSQYKITKKKEAGLDTWVQITIKTY